jgi:hypothetical protein
VGGTGGHRPLLAEYGHRRCQEWGEAGGFLARWKAGLLEYDWLREHDWSWLSLDRGRTPDTPLRSAPRPLRLAALPHCAQQRSLPVAQPQACPQDQAAAVRWPTGGLKGCLAV